MRVLVVHNEYRQPGGEERVVASEGRLLREAGFQVEDLRFRSADVEGAAEKLRVAWELPHSERAAERVKEAIGRFRPDVIHVHNFFPLATPAVFKAARELNVPSVFTLHNFRTFCANGLLLRGGKPCELCLDRRPSHAVKYRCYQGSLLGSAALARMIGLHHRQGTWHRLVDRFIVLTEFAKSRYLKGGLPTDLLTVKPNFLFDPVVEAAVENSVAPARARVLFVGRLSEEKGIATLLAAKREGFEIHVVGDGPLAPLVHAEVAKGGVVWHGFQSQEQVYAHIRAATVLVFPSECYENFPISLLEAMAHAKPVVASRIGGLPEIVREGETGWLFEPGNGADLAAKLRLALAGGERSGRAGQLGRERYLAEYAPASNLRALTRVYEEARAHRFGRTA